MNIMTIIGPKLINRILLMNRILIILFLGFLLNVSASFADDPNSCSGKSQEALQAATNKDYPLTIVELCYWTEKYVMLLNDVYKVVIAHPKVFK